VLEKFYINFKIFGYEDTYKEKIGLEEDIKIKKKVPILVPPSEKGMRKTLSFS